MKFTSKIILAFALFLTIFVSANVEVHAEEANKLIVHYFRFDQDYDPWSLWLWQSKPDAGEGENLDFNGSDNFGVYYEHELAGTHLEGASEVGVIVRDANWGKDVGQDRFIDMTSPNGAGEVHVYLVQNDPNIYYSVEEADISNKILSAAFADENTITFRATADASEDQITVYKGTTEIAITNFEMNNMEGSFDITEDVDLSQKYTLEIDFGDPEIASSNVGFDGFYESDAFNEAYGYEGALGAIYSESQTTFKLWAPISDAVSLHLYTAGHDADTIDYDGQAGVDDPYMSIPMTPLEKGVWSTTVEGDLDKVYYTYSVTNGDYTNELVDPYAMTTGVNGDRGMVINFDRYNPDNWENDTRPDNMVTNTDAIIYELHVRDLTSHETWTGTEAYRGKFLGLTEAGTTYQGVSTGFDHILDLGVTHVQLIPIFDHGIIDETRLNDPSYYGIQDGIFNWGYMPENFNALEGSYSTDPFNGEVRVEEFKEMIQTFHDNGIRVIMDVVYNHTGKSADSNFDMILPGYYFRMNSDGTFSNGSGTGNETASERFMFRKYMVDSLLYWTEEFHIDGYRFDLMKLHDVDTMNAIADELHAIDPTIMIYGEPWNGGTSKLSEANAAYNANLDRMPGIGVFNDDTRDGIKGSVFEEAEKGFVQGNNYADARVLLGVTGATSQNNLPLGALPKGPWAYSPNQTINYVTAHDNNTLHDKLYLSTFASIDTLERMQRQANTLILTSQGVPFLHAGVEMMRTKPCVVIDGVAQGECDSQNRFDHNSYRSPDETNQIDWNWKVDYYDTFAYYKAMIHLRQTKDVFTLGSAEEISQHLQLILDDQSGFVSYLLHDESDEWKTTYLLFNNGYESREVHLLEGTWNVVATTDEVGDITDSGLSTLYVQEGGQTITLGVNDTLIMYSTETVEYDGLLIGDSEDTPDETNGLDPLAIVGIAVGAVAILAGGVLIIRKRG